MGIEALIVTIPGSPLSLGALGSLAFGAPVLLTNKARSSRIISGLLIVYIGSLIGAFFSADVIGNVSAALGQFLLLIGVYGLAIEFSKQNKYLFWMLDIFMFACWLYWLFYILGKLPQISGRISYSKLWSLGQALNHHIPGLLISVSAIYLSNRVIGYSKIASYAIFGLTIISCILIDSRSNVLFSIIGLLWMTFQHRKLSIRYILVTIISLTALFYSASMLLEDYDFLKRRFDIKNEEYQTSTVQSRLYFYQEFLVQLIRLPLGRGLENTKIEYEYKMMLLHNQFLTFIIAGGLLALLGVVLILRTAFKILFLYRYSPDGSIASTYILPLKGTMLILMATLTTIEFGGSIVYLTFATMAFLEIQYTRQTEAERKTKQSVFRATQIPK